MHPAERTLLAILPWLGAGLASALPLLAVPTGRPLLVSTAHLAAVVGLGLAAALALAPLADEPGWFASLGAFPRAVAAAATVIVVVTGMVGLVTLATGAALRLDPSLQFLQLLGALDIAWAAAAIVIGARRGWGRVTALAGGTVLGIVCVWSIWNYLRTVGFTAQGGWVVDAGELMRLVLPFDAAAALLAAGVLVAGTRRAHPIAQLRPQS